MEGDSTQQAEWSVKRRDAYYGSRLHFIRSYYDSTLDSEGFVVNLYGPTKYEQFVRVKNPYDTAYYYFDDSTANAELYFPKNRSPK